MRSAFLLIAVAAVMVGCTDLTKPASLGCISPVPLDQGQTDQGTLSGTSCIVTVNGNAVPFYEYPVFLAGGGRYEFSVESDGTFAPVVELRDGTYDGLLATGVPGNEAGTISEVHFVAPSSGTYLIRLRPATSTTGGAYGVLSTGCGGSDSPLIGPTYASNVIVGGDCTMRDTQLPSDSMIGKTHVLRVASAGNVTVQIQATGGAALRDLIIVGPPGSDFESVTTGVDTATVQFAAPVAGDYLLMVGSEPFGATGSYTITVQ